MASGCQGSMAGSFSSMYCALSGCWWPLRQPTGLRRPFSLTHFAEDTAQSTADGAMLLILPPPGFPRGSKRISPGPAVQALCVYLPTVAFPLLKRDSWFCEWCLTVLSNSARHSGARSWERSASTASKGFCPPAASVTPCFSKMSMLCELRF